MWNALLFAKIGNYSFIQYVNLVSLYVLINTDYTYVTYIFVQIKVDFYMV